MKVFRNLEDPQIRTSTIVTMGVFDGLHLGHQAIIARVRARAAQTGQAATVVTFDPHPRAVIHPETAPPLLQTFEQKMEGLKGLGIEQVLVIHFTPDFSLVSAEEFLLATLFGRLQAQEVYLGQGFAFGHNREGRYALLQEVANRLHRIAEEVPEVLLRSRRVSSTMIRRLLSAGRVNLARRMLGRPYGIESRVIEGRKIGKGQIGFATANLKPHNAVLPANGVYVTLTLLEGEWRRSLTNIGHRPTFGGDSDVTVETHVIDFDREIYGEKIRVRFLHRLRDEKKFDSVDALRAQIDRDYRRAVRYFETAWLQRNLTFR